MTLFFRVFLFLTLLMTTSLKSTTLIHNINGYTPTASGSLHFEGLLIDDDGRVLQTLSQQAVEEMLLDKIKINHIDGNGKYMLPGLIDAHAHILGYGMALSTVDLVGTQSANEAAKRVLAYAEKNPDQQWITGRGWNQVLWKGKQFPDTETLNKVVADKPVALNRIDGHAMWVNSKALEMAGITKDTLDPEGGELLRDSEGNPTGILVDNAMTLVSRRIPSLSQQARQALITKSMNTLIAEGITSVHDAGVSAETISVFKNLAVKGQSPVRVYAMLDVTADGYQELIAKGPEKSLYDDLLSIQSIKIVLDGALGSRGAALDEPYSDRGDTSGLLLHSEADTEAISINAMKAGFQVNTHAIGDRGNRLMLDIFAKYPKYQNLRNRMEHAQIVHIEDIPRFKALNVIPSMQPTHATSDKNMAKDRLGEERLEGAYAWRKFLNIDVAIASGSDFPVEPSNPFFGLHAAVTRQDRENQPLGGWRSEEKMTREEALRSFTLDAAYAAHQENVLGSLEKGKWADFILLEQDYFSIKEEHIWKIKVLETWQAGKPVYFQKN